MNKTIALLTLVTSAWIGNPVAGQSTDVDLKLSTVTWEGGKVIGGDHAGEIKIKSAELEMNKTGVLSGTFTMDMASMTNTDLGEEYGAKLMGHLKSPDFFAVEQFPEAQLVIAKASSFQNETSTVEANVSIKGITERVTFEVQRDGQALDAILVLDRSKFDVRYGSNSFFDNLGDNAISDEFILNIHVVVL